MFYRPPANLFAGSESKKKSFSLEFQAEFWKAKAGWGPRSPETATDSGCAADRTQCALNRTLYAEHCRYCSNRTNFTLNINVNYRRRYPIVGLGGYMVSFDGGDDFMVTEFQSFPQYEFGLQFWFQQNKIRGGQSLFTWWSAARGREWEVADTSNIFYYHLNNKTHRTGVGINDGKWHNVAFSWRLHCKSEMRIPGATYCVDGRRNAVEQPTFTADAESSSENSVFSSTTAATSQATTTAISTTSMATTPAPAGSDPSSSSSYLSSDVCNIDRHCTHVEVTLFVDGVKRAESALPAFLPSKEGQLLFGQGMQKPYKTSEVKRRDDYTQDLRFRHENVTSNLVQPFSDNQLQLIFSRLRSGYYNNSQLFEASLSKQVRESLFIENEPWREPDTKYCDLTAPGGFRPGSGLSGNIDEFRMYDYYRTQWDISLGMNLVLVSDGKFTFSPIEGNWSLLLYYNFDLTDPDYKTISREEVKDWPLTIQDDTIFNALASRKRPSQLGGGTFRWAPLRVPSTAPIYGSRTIQIVVPDRTEPIPINLIDLQFDPDTPRSGIYTQVEEPPEFGPLKMAADDCDSVRTVTENGIVYRPTGCKGSIIGFFYVGGTPTATATTGCTVGTGISASDSSGSGMSAIVTEVSVCTQAQKDDGSCKGEGAITEIEMLSMGYGYDWTYVSAGLKWENIGTVQPASGRKLENTELAEALTRGTEFTQQQWKSFGINDLRNGDFIESHSGLKWTNVGARPTSGRELQNSQLAAALESKTEFTQQEWNLFGVSDFNSSDFIAVGNCSANACSYFKPPSASSFFKPAREVYSPLLISDNNACLCLLKDTTVPGNLNDCLDPIISAGKADTQQEFAGYDFQRGVNGLPVFYRTPCTGGSCVGVKPRPCHHSCHRDKGWMTDQVNEPIGEADSKLRFFVGPFSMYVATGFPTVYWSNIEHTIWYVPDHLRQANYRKPTKGNEEAKIEDTIKDQFVVRFYDRFPDSTVSKPESEATIFTSNDPDDPPEYVHLWVQLVYEKLAIPLNISVIGEESSSMLIQLHHVDFDRGTSVLNAPFTVHADLPSRGALFQAVRIQREGNEEEFLKECVCPTRPRFPIMNRSLEQAQYPADIQLPGIRSCNVSDIGFFCFKKGSQIFQNDTLVESTMDTLVLKGIQHARDGMFVIYDMGIEESGTAQFYWRVKYPQGQVVNATVDIQIRSINNRPVATSASMTTDEDTYNEIKLDAHDVDDQRKPAMYVTQFPAHGTLHQCDAASRTSPCRPGEIISRINASKPHWARVRVDPEGGIDDELTAVLRVLDSNPDNPDEQRITRNSANTSTVLAHGYGFGSYNFDPDAPDNFKKLCGTRGSIAADLLLEAPIFVTDIDFFYPLRPDTPFRILAQRPRQFESVSYDYNTEGRAMKDFQVTDTKVTKEGYNFEKGRYGIHFVDDGKWKAEQSFSYKRVDCGRATGEYKQQTTCQQIWDGSSIARGEERSTITEDLERWFELYRGLPHQARAEHDRISPVLPESLFQTSQLRFEACGANMRIFGESPSNFLESVHRVRVWGSKTERSKGFVTAADRRLVYVPDYNFKGSDSFKLRVHDHGGGALRSSSEFSLQRHWSPVVNVDIEVRAKVDKPSATSVVARQVLGTASSEIVIATPGVHPGPRGDASGMVTSFDIEITKAPERGRLLTSDGRSPEATALVNYNGILKYRALEVNGCGGGSRSGPFDFFEYRVKNSAAGDNEYSRKYKVTIEVRCKTGYTCDLPTFRCKACPPGSHGHDSEISNTCHLCPAGTFQDTTAAQSCVPCPPGSYNPRPGSEKCDVCPQGTYNALDGQASCLACPGGTHAPFVGMTECLKCGSKHWTLTSGSFTCKDCPKNTRARIHTAVGINSCECEHGYYNVHGKTGVPCLPCPPGAYCHGRSLLPVARTGYWTSRDIWTDDFEDMETGNVTLGVAHFAPCSFRYLRGVCIGYPDIDVQEQEERCQYRDHNVIQGPARLDDFTSEGLDVNISFCTLRDLSVPGEAAPEGLRSWIIRQAYTSNSKCAEGYMGVICSQCADNWYRGLTGYCFQCSVIYSIPFLGVLILLVIFILQCCFWVLLFTLACHRARSMYITITHFQLIAMLARLGVPWPDYVQGPISFSSVFNLAMDFVPWNCIGVRSTFEVRQIMEMFVPVAIVLGIYFSYYLRVRIALADILAAEKAQRDGTAEVSTVRPVTSGSARENAADAPNVKDSAANALDRASVATQEDVSILSAKDDGDSGSEKSNADEEDQEKQRQAELEAAKTSAGRDFVKLMTPKEIRRMRDAGIWYTSMALNVLFVMALSTLLLPFNCTKVSNTMHYLDWFPEFSCDSQIHSNFIFFSYILGGCWMMVFPSLMIYILRKGWLNELIMDRLFIRQFGFLFECYEAKYFWWEVAILFRKAVVVVIANSVTDNTYLALLALSVFLVIHLFWTFYTQPYVQERHTIVDIWLQMQLLLLLVFSFTNIVGNDGMKIITTETGSVNDNRRIKILEPEPDMDMVADKMINANVITNLVLMAAVGLSALGNLGMVLYDLYESRVHAPEWAPYLFNGIYGCELWEWDEFVSHVLSNFDKLFTMLKDRNKVKPPTRPASRWAHRVMMMDGVAKVEDFSTHDSVESMLAAAVATTQQEEWARDKESCIDYIRSLDKRIFASEMYNSKAANLPILERERNLAKKRLIQFLYDEVGDVFKSLYDQTGLNEQTLWDIAELERLRQEKATIEAGEQEHRKHLLTEDEEQRRRVGSVAKWKVKYEKEVAQCQVRVCVCARALVRRESGKDEKGTQKHLC